MRNKEILNVLFLLLLTISLLKITTSVNVFAGNFTHIYDPSVGQQDKWYINDHTFVKDTKGIWHLFGITHKEPVGSGPEILFAHASAPNLLGPWTKHEPALKVDYKYFNEDHLWAPHVILVNDTYHMFFNGGNSKDRTQYAISLATSKDLFNWTRIPSGPLFRDGFDARDPMVIKINDLWHLYYCASETPKGGHHIVGYRTSTDLLKWSERHVAYTDPSVGTEGGPTESPFVVLEKGIYYLFIGPRNDYRKTAVFMSKKPHEFLFKDKVGEIHSHAAEVINDGGKYWISHCGWGMGGVYLAPLHFE